VITGGFFLVIRSKVPFPPSVSPETLCTISLFCGQQMGLQSNDYQN
jgi:hypothetical protein